MESIQVPDSRLLTTAEKIEDYLTLMNNKMKEAENAVNTLLNKWQGADAREFKEKWGQLEMQGSAYREMVDALTHYENYLRYADKQYSRAQYQARTQANRLIQY